MQKIERIAIVGAGAMGTLLGACLTRRGLDVLMVDANPKIVDAINQNGMTVHGTTAFHVKGRACETTRLEGIYDLVILLTKQTHNQTAFAQILPHLSPEGVLLTLQNGVPEPSVAEVFGEERTMGGAVTWAAILEEPGVTRATTELENWHTSLGRPDGAVTPKVLAVQKILEHMCKTEVATNLIGMRWSKLLINSSFSGMSAVLGCTFGQVSEAPIALRCAQYIARECILTARAAGIRFEPLTEGENLDELMFFEDESDRERTTWIFKRLLMASAMSKASMLMDLENGRPTEIDYINGVVCQTAAACDLEVPFCSQVVEIVKTIEKGQRAPSIYNLALLPDVPACHAI